MFIAPKKAPLIIGVTFDVARTDHMPPITVTTCWRENGLKGVALTDAALDWNQHFHQVAGDPSVTSATATVVFNHSLRVCLPIPPAGKGAGLQSLGALVSLIVEMMATSGEFLSATPENHLILYVATLAGISVASPPRGSGRQHALNSKRSHTEPRPVTETEWRQEQERQRKRLYYLANSERIKSNSLRYKQDNPNKVREYTRTYNEKHRSELNDKASDYYEKNKEAINRKHRARYAKKALAVEPS